MASYNKSCSENVISIIRAETVEAKYTAYVIEIQLGAFQWQVKHRYSEFHELNEQLISEHGLDKKLLPPKKAFNYMSEAFVQKRRSALERYLQTLLSLYERIPFELATFLEFQKYEINGVTQILAQTLFSRGDSLLEKSATCSMDPLQLHSISTRLTEPDAVVSNQERDIGHILDFVTRLKKLRVIGTDKLVGTSNINMNQLQFNLAMFKSVTYVELVKCNMSKVNGLDHLRPNLEKLKLKKTLTDAEEFLMHSAPYWQEEGEEGATSTSSMLWPKLTWVDMSENNISSLPPSMKYLERMEYLDLHDNYIETVENLEAASYLTHLDLSINRIEHLPDLHLKLGNVKTMNLAGNKLETMAAFSKLYSLEYLDVRNNQISQVVELRCLGSLPLLENLMLTGNPVTVVPDYRIQVLKIFGSRAKEVYLDNKKATEKELGTVAVLIALDQAKQPTNTARVKSSEVTSSPGAGGLLSSSVPTTAVSLKAGPSSSTDQSPASLHHNDSSHTLDAPVLGERLHRLRPSQLATPPQVQTPNLRFDSPFNSPTRSSTGSDQQFHSLSSTPKECSTSDGNEGDVEDNVLGAEDRTPPDGSSNNPDTDTAVVSSSPQSHQSAASFHPISDSDHSQHVSSSDEEAVQQSEGQLSRHSSHSLHSEVKAEEESDDVTSNPALTSHSVSLDLVDHLEKCLANFPPTLELDSCMERLRQMEGEELLNLFYHDEMMSRAGDGKEELCHAMWTSLTLYNSIDLEKPCLVLLSNQATYFISSSEDDSYIVNSIRHADLQEVSVGVHHQSVRLGGLTDTQYYCCISRDPTLVHVFTSRLSFIVDTDFVRPTALDGGHVDSEEEVSIYDSHSSHADQSAHPSGVRFINDEETVAEDFKRLLLASGEGGDVEIVLAAYIHVCTSLGDLRPCTLALTNTALHLIKELYANHPLPECVHIPPDQQTYTLQRSIKLENVSDMQLEESDLRVDLNLKNGETLHIVFSSLNIAKSLLSSCIASAPS